MGSGVTCCFSTHVKVLQQKVAEQLLRKGLEAFSSCNRRH